MRTALLAAQKRTETGELRAFQLLGGRNVLTWQYDLLRAFGCERIVCLCEASRPEIIELQHTAENDGVHFHAIKGSLQLVGLITADENVIMLRDGLVAEADLFNTVAQSGRLIASLPADSAPARDFPQDFERIDANRAWAGLAIFRGNLAERLADLPADSDTMSLLLRLALQAGVRDAPIDPHAVADGRWLLATDPNELEKRQAALITRSNEAAPWTGPGRAFANFIVQKLAPSGMERGPVVSGALGTTAMLAMFGAFWLEQAALGLSLGAIGSFALAISRAGSRLKASLFGKPFSERKSRGLNAGRDVVTVGALALPALTPALNPTEVILPALAIGLARLASLNDSSAISVFWADRTTHLLLLAVCAIFGQLPLGIAVFAALALAQCIVRFRAY